MNDLQVEDAIAFRSAAVEFKSPDGATYVAVRDMTLSFRDGEFVAVVGPTGCGKSTLLNLVAGILRVSSGGVSIFGQPVDGIPSGVGYMFQNDALLPWLSARDNIALGLRFRRENPASARARAEAWLNRVGLGGFGDRFPHQLSGGMRKRVSLAQMMIMDPRIILMDEPFSALDVQTRQLMENELLDIWAANRRTVVFVTHDLEEAICLADRVVVLSVGPGTTPIAEYTIDLARPRDVTEIIHSSRFGELREQIWGTLKSEVLKGYQAKRAS
jgi:NitT/TauT family transport system ATP-binding protein